LELVKDTAKLFKNAKVEQKRKLLNFLYWNLQLEHGKLVFSLRKPFDVFLEEPKDKVWLWRQSGANLSQALIPRLSGKIQGINAKSPLYGNACSRTAADFQDFLLNSLSKITGNMDYLVRIIRRSLGMTGGDFGIRLFFRNDTRKS